MVAADTADFFDTSPSSCASFSVFSSAFVAAVVFALFFAEVAAGTNKVGK